MTEIVDELGAVDVERKVRVYANNSDNDFVITLPANCSLTFGYFNPGKPSNDQDFGMGRKGKSDTERASALRVYGPSDGTKKDQLACFLGVKGFRDESVKMTKIVKKVTVEQRYVDDGEGTIEYGGKRLAELTMKGEDDELF